MTEPAIDTGMILEALNDKVDRDCNNSIPIIPKFTLLCDSIIQKDSSVIFSDDPANYDFFIHCGNELNMIMTGRYFNGGTNGRLKLTGIWAGKDSYEGSFYEQIYICDLVRTSGNTFTCWSLSWSPTHSVQFSEVSGRKMKIYGVKL